uniref:Putative portal protein n=2 Tax=viral metagenome TaxID=1070528 RepID=A0A6M3KTG5_9ZZZZ
MNIFEKLFRTKAPIPNRNYFNAGGIMPSANFTSEGMLGLYQSVGWLHAVVFRIALGCSEVEWTLFDASNQDKPKQIYKHPILKLLKQVNPFQTSNEFIALDTIYNELIGESFWALNFNALGEPAEIILPYPNKMSVVPAANFPFVKGYVYGTGADSVPFDVNEIIHFKYPNPLNQYRGLAPAKAIGINLDAEQNADKWVNQFFYNSARPDGVIQFDYNLSDEQFEKLKKQWSEKYKGVSKAHQVALLEGGGKYLQIQNTIKDMDFANLKQKNRDVILGVFGMPQSVMGISENVNKANAEAGDYTFARWIVKPRLDWKKAKIQEQLIPKFRRSENLQIGFCEVVPETAEQKVAQAESGMRAGYLTVNEARKTQGLDPIPNGDVLLVPLNLIPTPINGKPETPEETPEEENPLAFKSLTPDQKRIHWEAYAKKTERQEEMFNKVFENVFNDQKEKVVAEIERTGELPPLDDEDTAKRFEAAIQLVYEDSFNEAV